MSRTKFLRAVSVKIIKKAKWVISQSQRGPVVDRSWEEARKYLKNVSLLYLIIKYPGIEFFLDFFYFSWVRQSWSRDLIFIFENFDIILIISFYCWIKIKVWVKCEQVLLTRIVDVLTYSSSEKVVYRLAPFLTSVNEVRPFFENVYFLPWKWIQIDVWKSKLFWVKLAIYHRNNVLLIQNWIIQWCLTQFSKWRSRKTNNRWILKSV